MQPSDPMIAVAWKLLETSCGRRYSYAERARIILAADALVAGSLVFFVDKLSSTPHGIPWYFCFIALSSFVVLLCSLFFSFQAIMDFLWVKRSRQVVPNFSAAHRRPFFSPPDTIREIDGRGVPFLTERLRNLTGEELFGIICAELYLDIHLQLRRYRRLQLSATLLVLAFILVSLVAIYYVLQLMAC